MVRRKEPNEPILNFLRDLLQRQMVRCFAPGEFLAGFFEFGLDVHGHEQLGVLLVPLALRIALQNVISGCNKF
jgi:hypothetical protein